MAVGVRQMPRGLAECAELLSPLDFSVAVRLSLQAAADDGVILYRRRKRRGIGVEVPVRRGEVLASYQDIIAWYPKDLTTRKVRTVIQHLIGIGFLTCLETSQQGVNRFRVNDNALRQEVQERSGGTQSQPKQEPTKPKPTTKPKKPKEPEWAIAKDPAVSRGLSVIQAILKGGDATGLVQWTQEADGKNCATSKQKRTAKAILNVWASDDAWIAQRFGRKTRFGIIDVDAGSRYRNLLDLRRVVAIFEALGVPLIPFRSSAHSEGVHLLMMFDKPVKTDILAAWLRSHLIRHGFALESGQMEIYPSGGASAIRLPMQRGYGLIDLADDESITASGVVINRSFEGVRDRLAYLGWLADHRVSQRTTGELRIRTTKQTTIRSPQQPRDEEKYERGYYLYRYGLQHPSTRNQASQDVCYYLYCEGYDADARERLLVQWLTDKHNGMSKTWLQKPGACLKELSQIAHWKPKVCPTTRSNNRYSAVNYCRAATAKAKIETAIQFLATEGELWKKNGTINRAAIARKAEVARQTINKYLSLNEDPIIEIV